MAYAGDFTWDRESEAFFMRHRLSNGQFCIIAFYRWMCRRSIGYSVAFAVADKKKNLNGWLNQTKDDNITLKMTGRCGVEALYWCRDRLLEFEKEIMLDKVADTKIVVGAEDSKRFRLYSKALARYGYKKVMTPDGWTMQKSLGRRICDD